MLRFKIKETFVTRILGSAPANKEIYQEFIASKKAEAEEKRKAFAARHSTDVQPAVGTIEEEVATINEESGVTVFHNDLGQVAEDGTTGKGIHFLDYQVCGFYKEAAEALNEAHGIPMVRSKLDNYLMVEERRVYITDAEGKVLTKPDGRLERPLRAMTMQGPRVSLACSEVINPGAKIEYTLNFLPYIKTGKGKEAKKMDVHQLVEMLVQYGGRKGRGQWRTGGNGRFTATIEEIK